MRLVKLAAVEAFSAVALVLAAPAQADEASYMDYLRSHGWGPQ